LCVSEYLPSSASVDLSGTDLVLYPFEPHEDTNFQEIWLPPTSVYPYFLFPGTAGPRLSSAYYELDLDLASALEKQHFRHLQHAEGTMTPDHIAGRPKIFLYPHSVPPDLQDSSSAIRVYQNNRWETQWLHVRSEPRRFQNPNPSSPTSRTPSSFTSSFSPTTTSLSSIFLATSWYPFKHDRDSISTTFTTHKSQHANGHDERHQHRHHNQHHHRHNQHDRDRNPQLRPSALPQPPALAQPPASSTFTTVAEHTPDHRRYGAISVAGRRIFAPRPTYEHGIVYERVDEELDEFRIGQQPLDRHSDLREAFDGFVDSGS
jgi:hypothetical protein